MRTVRIGTETAKGCPRKAFDDAFARHLPEHGVTPAQQRLGTLPAPPGYLQTVATLTRGKSYLAWRSVIAEPRSQHFDFCRLLRHPLRQVPTLSRTQQRLLYFRPRLVQTRCMSSLLFGQTNNQIFVTAFDRRMGLPDLVRVHSLAHFDWQQVTTDPVALFTFDRTHPPSSGVSHYLANGAGSLAESVGWTPVVGTHCGEERESPRSKQS